ncbi:thiol-disulfide isomerase/thioredoxin [Melghiribacillus thermohalophilus]|uniref:Thiol-disulfide isomerase/thioredoxin n=2 Tax=Melghiribacillus thermohalophilus TaxID=1324956 RepID=A0A4R3MTY2_9BACI|nr:thiol-disulfide isomerase/thioredoxin [Melghiribacillus thermohalophilus]
MMKWLSDQDELLPMISRGKTVLLFSADWCPDCRLIEPFMPEIEKKYEEFQFVYVDRDDFIDLCQEYDVFGIPSFIAFENGVEIGRFVSKDRKTREEIEAFLDDLQA